MRQTGIKDAGYAHISVTEATAVGDCSIACTASVQPRAIKLSGHDGAAVPDATCSTSDTPYAANWLARGRYALILSNLIPKQVALFTDVTVNIDDASNGKTLGGLRRRL